MIFSLFFFKGYYLEESKIFSMRSNNSIDGLTSAQAPSTASFSMVTALSLYNGD